MVKNINICNESNLSLPDILLDYGGYPIPAYLEFIRDFKEDTMPIMDFIDIVCNNWYYGSYGYKLHKKYKGVRKFELHTLGWGGNEEIIRLITNNIYLTHYHMKYYQWRTGGHYYFEIPIK
jgi:hypothetical protein